MTNLVRNLPKISVVTVCYNAAKDIEETIKSVVKQNYTNIEYIIIDGGSTDGTIDIVNKYRHKIDYLVSEPDNGIYDAMNKGLKIASGQWVNFMNAGDTFVNDEVLHSIFSKEYDTKVKVIYGDSFLKDTGKVSKARRIDDLNYEMPFLHQSSFVRNDNIFFRTDLRIASDYDLFRRIYNDCGSEAFCYITIPVSIFDLTGISSTNVMLLRSEYNQLYKEYNSRCFYFYNSIKLLLKKIVRL